MLKERIPYIFLIAALLAVPFYFMSDKMDTEQIRKDRYWMVKANDQKSYAMVIGGDSRVFRGISPDHFESGFNGYEAYNFAFWSNGMGRVYLEGMEKKIDTAADLRMIILGITPHSLTPKAARCEHYRWETGKPKEQVLQTLYLSRVQELFVPYGVIELADKVRGKSKQANYRIIYHSNGWVESYWIEPDTSYSARFYEDIFTDNAVSEEVIEVLLEFVERWTGMGIHVVGFRPPTSHTIIHLEEERGGFVEEDFVEQFTGAGGIWIPLSPDDYQTFDGNHLEHQSAMRISADLARLIREQISRQ